MIFFRFSKYFVHSGLELKLSLILCSSPLLQTFIFHLGKCCFLLNLRKQLKILKNFHLNFTKANAIAAIKKNLSNKPVTHNNKHWSKSKSENACNSETHTFYLTFFFNFLDGIGCTKKKKFYKQVDENIFPKFPYQVFHF